MMLELRIGIFSSLKSKASMEIATKTKKTASKKGFLLVYQDSNLERLNQNQMCYHYTIDQIMYNSGAKVNKLSNETKFLYFFSTSLHNP